MQLDQGYWLSVGERSFLVRVQLKVTQQLTEHMYALGILLLIKFLLEFVNLNEMNAEEVAFAEDFSVASSLNSIKGYWDKLTVIGSPSSPEQF